MNTIVVLEANGVFGWILREADGDRSAFIQTDWDYPALASDLGIWSTKHEGLRVGEACSGFDRTDGTVACPVCGKSAHEFIVSAGEALQEHAGEEFEEFEDPGYFQC